MAPRGISRRTRFFVGCEGESEQGYVAFLQTLSDRHGLSVHLDNPVIPKAGSPLALVNRAIQIFRRREGGGKPAYRRRFLLLDTDLMGLNAEQDAEMERTAAENKLYLVRQVPCFEAVLLRHTAAGRDRRPPTSAEAMRHLKAQWPEYRKGGSAQDLAGKFGLDDVRRAASQPIQADLSDLLRTIGLL